MFGWFCNLGFIELINLVRGFFNPFKKYLPTWIYYSLPDALWVYSFTSIYLILWNNRINYWLIIPFFFGCLLEIAQSLKIVDGTYDPIDLIFSLLAFILSIFINQLIKTNEKKIKITSSLLVAGFFLIIAYGSGDKDKKKWEPNNKELFCGIRFTNDDYREQIDMKITRETILNSDGTYISKSGWGAVGNDSKEEYNSTVGRSSEEDSNFSGTWEIVQPTESMKQDGSTQKYKPTYIKFKSSNGTGGYAVILCMKYNVYYYLHLNPMDANGNYLSVEDSFRAGMYGGEDLCEDIENIE